MYSLQITLLLIFIGGLIAYLGDLIGRRTGRRRVSLFGLRPRYTAVLITIISGILIVVLSVGILSLFSEDARTALFGLELIKTRLQNKTRELTELKKIYENEIKEKIQLREVLSKEVESTVTAYQKISAEVAGLRTEQTKIAKHNLELKKILSGLEENVARARRGNVLFKINEAIISTLIAGGGDPSEIEILLKDILAEADSLIRNKSAIPQNTQALYLPENELEQAIHYILEHPSGDLIVRLVSAQNVVYQEMVLVHFELFENALIFKQAETIVSSVINGQLSKTEIRTKFNELLTLANNIARLRGVLPDPTGSVGNIPFIKINNAVARVRFFDAPVEVKISAGVDIYTKGPLEADFNVGE
jgi:uncharacterized protein (DUF3084 family)